MNWLNIFLDVLTPGWVGSIIGLVGVVAAVLTYFLTRQRTKLAFCCAGERLLGDPIKGLPDGVTVQYRGENVPRLARSFVFIWNAGEKTIVGEDIVGSDPLRVQFGEQCRVLAGTVLKQKRDVCKFQRTLRDREVEFSFLFLDPGDGAVIEILHTDTTPNGNMRGTVRGLPQGLQDKGLVLNGLVLPQGWGAGGIRIRLAGILFSLISTICLALVLSLPGEMIFRPDTDGHIPSEAPIVVSLMLLLSAAFGVYVTWTARRRYPPSLELDRQSLTRERSDE